MSLVRFAVDKPVPVNLLMVALIAGGIWAGLQLRREFFPEVEPEIAIVSLTYPGATPEEIETSLATKVEDKLAELKDVEKLTTTLAEGGGGIEVRFKEGIGDVDKAVRDVERAIDALTDLPDEAERTTVRELEPQIPVIILTAYGDVDEMVLKRAVRSMHDELRALPGMGDIIFGGVREYEIRVELDNQQLMAHGISLPQVADLIRAWMTEVPGGTVRSEGGNFKVRTMGTEERSEAIRQIVLRSSFQGDALRVGDVATVHESFVDEDVVQRYNGRPSANLTVFKSGKQDIVHMAAMVRAYIAGKTGQPYHMTLMDRLAESREHKAYMAGLRSPDPLPAGVSLDAHADFSRYVQGRLDLLLNNAKWGALLVFGTLLLFLNWRVALWVGAGMVTALLGTLLLMWWMDMSLNFLTMFGLIIVVGILVDDGIVVSENIQAWHDRGVPALEAAVSGTQQVLWPVVVTVTTNIVAFLPLTFVRGQIGDLMGALPLVVTFAMIMSLVEALIVLPSHLGHSLKKRDAYDTSHRAGWIRRIEARRDKVVFGSMIPWYTRFMRVSLEYRYISTAIALAVLIICIGLVAGGRAPYTFMPKSDSETIIVDLRLPIGTPIDKTEAAVSLVEQAAQAQVEVRGIESVIGSRASVDTGQVEAAAAHVAQIWIELTPVEERNRQSQQVIQSMRQWLGDKLPEVERMRYSEITGGPGEQDITVVLRGKDEGQLEAAAGAVKAMLAGFAGVQDIADDNDLGQPELRFEVTPRGAAAGFTNELVARQVRGALFGIDAHTFSAHREDIDVRVRLDEPTRRSLYAVENLWVISPQGQAVPLRQVANLEQAETYSTIKRIDRQRAVSVMADVAPGYSPEDIVKGINEKPNQPSGFQKLMAMMRGHTASEEDVSPLDKVRSQFPQLDITYGGRQEQEMKAFASLPIGFLAAVMGIYILLAILFNSLTQPLTVMLTIPFTITGTVLGHLIMGYEMTFLSMIGFVALSGIVVNDSLVFVEFFNQRRAKGVPLVEALLEAGQQRVRPILLTTLTTILGLTPLMLETSFQARFLIPMAITISFGLMSSTVLVLTVLPCVLVILDDMKRGGYYLWHGRPRPVPAAAEAAVGPSTNGAGV
ncbi:MAG: efflux RND transporter permease subunit [Phycisphaeraceae bacterium]